jgi:hypothetical protein
MLQLTTGLLALAGPGGARLDRRRALGLGFAAATTAPLAANAADPTIKVSHPFKPLEQNLEVPPPSQHPP